MKKIIAVLLAVSVVLSLVGTPVTTFAENLEFLVSESYNEQTSGAVPVNGAVIGGNPIIAVTTENKDKAIEMSSAIGDNSIYYNASLINGVNLSMFAEFEYKNSWSYTEIFIKDNTGKSMTLAYINEKGEFCSADGRRAASIAMNKTVSVQLTYNVYRRMLSAYINGKSVIKNRYMGSAAFEDISGYGILTKGKKDSNCYVDNFVIFEGDNVIGTKDVPVKAFNPQSLNSNDESGSVHQNEFVGDAVFFSRNFDEEYMHEFEGIHCIKNDNEINVVKSLLDDNKYVKLEKINENQGYLQFVGCDGINSFVMEADFSTETLPPAGWLIYAYYGKASNVYAYFVKVDKSGNVLTSDNKPICKLERLKWVNIAVAIDIKTNTYSVYLNDKLMYEGIKFNAGFTNISLFRSGFQKGVGSGNLLIDNVKIYEGTKPREITGSMMRTKPHPDSVAQNYLGSAMAVHSFASTYYVNQTKYDAKHKMILENNDEDIFVHKEDIESMFGTGVILGTEHSEQKGYFNISDVAKLNGYSENKRDSRLAIFSRGTLEYTEDELDEIQRYMFHIRPSAEELRELFESYNGNQHPRILINESDLERIKNLYKTDPLVKKWGDELIKKVENDFGKPLEEFKVYGEGDRAQIRNISEAIVDVANISMAYHLTGNKRYVNKVWKMLETICLKEDWNPICPLDVGDAGFMVSLGYDWLYDEFTPEQRQFIEENLYEKCVKFAYDLYHYEHDKDKTKYGDTGYWENTGNWCSVCNGGPLCAAIALFDKYPEVASSVIEDANKAMEYMFPTYYPYGSWREGASYWIYATGAVAFASTSMKKAFGTDFNMSHVPALDKTGWFLSTTMGSTRTCAIGDTGSSFVSSAYVMWLASEHNDAQLMNTRINEIDKLNLNIGAYDIIFYNPEYANSVSEMPLDTFMEGMEVIGLRESWYDTGATYIGASGGASVRGHGHFDLGSFQIDMAGERFICDLGADSYSAEGYFSSKRQYYYRVRPEGHNMYIINPEDSLDYLGIVGGTRANCARAEGELVISKPRGAVAKMDLTQAYAPWATKAVRGYMLTDDRRSIVVRDEIDLIQPDSTVYYFLHLPQKVTVESITGNQAVLTANGKKILVTIDTNGTDYSLEETPAATINAATRNYVIDQDNTSRGYKKLTFIVTGSDRLNITAKFKQFDDAMVSDHAEEIDIDNWSIPDGEVTPLPEVKGIYVDGVMIERFDPKVTGYSKVVPSKLASVPQVTVDTDLKYEIIQASDFGDDAIIKVYATGRDDVYRMYRIHLYKKPPLADVDGMRRYPVAAVSASEVPQEENGMENVIDMDFGTRWSADSASILDQWIQLELDDTYPIEKIGVAWMNGNSRQYNYKLEISLDGITWTEVFNGSSSGATNACEYTALGGKMAKYVRYTGTGSNKSTWNSIVEIEVLGNQR